LDSSILKAQTTAAADYVFPLPLSLLSALDALHGATNNAAHLSRLMLLRSSIANVLGMSEASE